MSGLHLTLTLNMSIMMANSRYVVHGKSFPFSPFFRLEGIIMSKHPAKKMEETLADMASWGAKDKK